MKKIMILTLFSAIFLLIGQNCAWADEVEEEINSALDAYRQGDYSVAISSLDFAAQQIRQIKAGQTEKIFPDPLPGWRAESPESSAMGGAFMGGMITTSRRYTKASSSVQIEMISDSPMIGMMSGMLSNPMFTGAPGTRVIRINGKKGLLQWDNDEQRGELSILIDNNAMIKISGEDCEKDDVMAYADAIDYDKIQSIVSN